MILWCKRKNNYPARWICLAHIWSPTWFCGGIIIFQGVLTKLNFLTKFSHLEKTCQFNERPQIWTHVFLQSIIFYTIWWNNLTVSRILEKIFDFCYLSLRLSLAFPQKVKMLWCSYFRSFIKLTYFSELEIS